MKVIIITGGSRGLGRSAALECAARSMGVILTYNSHPEGADAVVAEIEAKRRIEEEHVLHRIRHIAGQHAVAEEALLGADGTNRPLGIDMHADA